MYAVDSICQEIAFFTRSRITPIRFTLTYRFKVKKATREWTRRRSCCTTEVGVSSLRVVCPSGLKVPISQHDLTGNSEIDLSHTYIRSCPGETEGESSLRKIRRSHCERKRDFKAEKRRRNCHKLLPPSWWGTEDDRFATTGADDSRET